MKKVFALLLSLLGFLTACDDKPVLMYGPPSPDWTPTDTIPSEMYGTPYKTFSPGQRMDADQPQEEVSTERKVTSLDEIE